MTRPEEPTEALPTRAVPLPAAPVDPDRTHALGAPDATVHLGAPDPTGHLAAGDTVHPGSPDSTVRLGTADSTVHLGAPDATTRADATVHLGRSAFGTGAQGPAFTEIMRAPGSSCLISGSSPPRRRVKMSTSTPLAASRSATARM